MTYLGEIQRKMQRAASPLIFNTTMTTANAEYIRGLPANTKKFTIRCRGSYDIKLAFVPGTSGTTYITIPSATVYKEDLIHCESIALCIQCAQAGQVAEIVVWT